MDKRTYKVLDFFQIKEILKELIDFSPTQELIEELYPSSELSVVINWQQETTEARLLLDNNDVFSLRGAKDISSILQEIERESLLPASSFLDILDNLRLSTHLRSHFLKHKFKYPYLASISEEILTLPLLEKEIKSKINLSGEVKDEASAELKKIRDKQKYVNHQIQNKLHHFLHSKEITSFLQEELITIREGRFTVPVKTEFKSQFPGIVISESASGATLFMEPLEVMDLNNDLKVLKEEEDKEVKKILANLGREVKTQISSLKKNLKIITKLDFIMAKGRLSRLMEGVPPHFNQRKIINLKKARHPLLKGKVVPIDFQLGSSYHLLIITGANTGGKTVTLKTIGLLTLMAQCGLHIPAEAGSELNVFDKIFADIGDEQSIEQSLSTFSSHIGYISKIVKEINDNSLVLLDEIGAGTDPAEGEALAEAILFYLYKKGICTVVTTHYGKLKLFAESYEGMENACVEFDPKTLLPTYKLTIGMPGKSNALIIAKNLGLKEDIIDYAWQVRGKENVMMEDILSSWQSKKEAQDKELKNSERLRKEYEDLKNILEKEYEDLKSKKAHILQSAYQEAKEIMRSAQEEAKILISQLQKAQKPSSETQKGMEEVKRKIKEIDERLREFSPTDEVVDFKKLKLGMKVYLKSIHKKGIITALPKSPQDKIEIKIGNLKIKTYLSDIKMLKEEREKSEYLMPEEVEEILKTKKMRVTKEIDVHRMCGEEALNLLEKYIDDAYLANLSYIQIIHGKGRGRLRAIIHGYLTEHPLIESFSTGKLEEGGTGVTIAYLKR